MYRGEGSADGKPGQGRRYENARRASKGRLLKAGGTSRKGKPRFMRALTRQPTYTTRVLLEQRELYKIANRDHMLAPCTPLKSNPVGTSPQPRLKMTQSKVWSYWTASGRSSDIATLRTATLNVGAQTSSSFRTQPSLHNKSYKNPIYIILIAARSLSSWCRACGN